MVNLDSVGSQTVAQDAEIGVKPLTSRVGFFSAEGHVAQAVVAIVPNVEAFKHVILLLVVYRSGGRFSHVYIIAPFAGFRKGGDRTLRFGLPNSAHRFKLRRAVDALFGDVVNLKAVEHTSVTVLEPTVNQVVDKLIRTPKL